MDKSDGQAKTDRTLGQIAYEAYMQWNKFTTPWSEITMAKQAEWTHVAQAVAQAVAPIPEPDDR